MYGNTKDLEEPKHSYSYNIDLENTILSERSQLQ